MIHIAGRVIYEHNNAIQRCIRCNKILVDSGWQGDAITAMLLTRAYKVGAFVTDNYEIIDTVSSKDLCNEGSKA